jgi:hypothetical protein
LQPSTLTPAAAAAAAAAAAGLPKFRNFNIRSNPSYPNTAAWFAALAARPAYQKVSSDDQTLQLLFQRMMGLTPGAAAAATRTSAAAAAAAAAAAFAKTQAEVETAAASEKELQAAKNEAYDLLQVWTLSREAVSMLSYRCHVIMNRALLQLLLLLITLIWVAYKQVC